MPPTGGVCGVGATARGRFQIAPDDRLQWLPSRRRALRVAGSLAAARPVPGRVAHPAPHLGPAQARACWPARGSSRCRASNHRHPAAARPAGSPRSGPASRGPQRVRAPLPTPCGRWTSRPGPCGPGRCHPLTSSTTTRATPCWAWSPPLATVRTHLVRQPFSATACPTACWSTTAAPGAITRHPMAADGLGRLGIAISHLRRWARRALPARRAPICPPGQRLQMPGATTTPRTMALAVPASSARGLIGPNPCTTGPTKAPAGGRPPRGPSAARACGSAGRGSAHAQTLWTLHHPRPLADPPNTPPSNVPCSSGLDMGEGLFRAPKLGLRKGRGEGPRCRHERLAPGAPRAPLFSLALEGEGWGEGGCFGEAAKPKSSTFLAGPPLVTLSWGRGRIGRPRPNSVRGLPRNQPRLLQRSFKVGLSQPADRPVGRNVHILGKRPPWQPRHGQDVARQRHHEPCPRR